MPKAGNIEAIYPLSPMQEGVLFHTLYSPGTMAYLEQFSYALEGDLNVSAFEKAWQTIVARHPVLRTLFTWEKRDRPLQIVRQRVKLPFAFHDWRPHPPSEQRTRLQALLTSDRERGFDLSKAPLMRLTLVRLGEHRYQFIWCFHHLLLDGWSGPIVLSEFLGVYEGLCGSEAPQLPARRPYRDYIAWLQDQDLSQAGKFWRAYLEGFSTPTPLGVDRPKTGSQGEAFAKQALALPEALTQRLNQFTKHQHVTMSTLAEGVWAILLSRYSNEEDVVFGSTVSGRTAPLEDIENMVGVFINTLPSRVHVRPTKPFAAWLTSLQARQSDKQLFAHSPLTHIQQSSELPSNLPLFESILVVENYPVPRPASTTPPTLAVGEMQAFEQTNYPLTIQVDPSASLRWQVQYDRNRFEDESIARMLGHLRTLLESIAADPQQAVGELAWLTEAERQQLLMDWNDTRAPFPSDRSIHELFEDQAQRRPEHTAVISEQGRLGYAELNRKANQLARHLCNLGVGPNVLVGVSMARSLEMVVAILGILKAGGAYLPIDAGYPAERIVFMLEDAAAPVLLTHSSLAEKLPQGQARIVCVDDEWPQIATQSDADLEYRSGPEDLAYVNYTSGSTGRPKGVEIPHRGVIRLVLGNDYARLDEDNVILHLSTISFDASTLELWGALLPGATCVLCPIDLPTPSQLADIIQRYGINFMWLTASFFNLIVDENAEALRGVQQLLTGGEALSVRHVRKALAVLDDTQLINGYGPTENTTFTCCYPIPRQLDAQTTSIPIGRPIRNTSVYLLDQRLQPVPIGVVGELYTGGDGLARGYLNRSDLTAAKFVPDPFSADPEARLYRTGDLARYTPDGNIEFIGRLDHQVKIRGFRIELGEIEAALEMHPAVSAAAIDIKAGEGDSKHLVAYVATPQRGREFIAGLRIFLQARLPDYMIPSSFMVLDKMPLMATGKIDRQALPASDTASIAIEKNYLAPRNALEATLAELWGKHLGVDKVGVRDRFFELGGHSLIAIRLIADIKKQLGKELPLPELFKRQTIEAIAQSLTRNRIPKKHGSLVPINPKGHKPPIFMVHCSDKLHFFLEDDQPLFLFLSFWGDEQRPLEYKSVEDMAADYIKDMQAIYPQGPYILCGFSIGGLIAIEMAKQLSERNGDAGVPLLFLIDPTIPTRCLATANGGGNPHHSQGKWKHRLRLLTDDLPKRPYQTVRRVLDKLTKRVSYNLRKAYNHGLFRVGAKYGWKIPKSAREVGASKLYGKAADIYDVASYAGPVEIVQLEAAYQVSDWKRIFTGEVVHHRIKEAGKHTDMVHDMEVVKIWAQHLKAALEKSPGVGH